jgi:hypothetical protein
MQCSVPGCQKHANRVGARMCEMHYGRVRRHGGLDNPAPAPMLQHSGGYLLAYAPGHPLARGQNPRVYAHRLAFYGAHGEGPFRCRWCAATVGWDGMHIDHLDDDKQNNDPANLVPSCPVCNQQRGKHKLIAAHRAKTGLTVNGRTQTINEWAAEVGLARTAICARLARGWAPEAAVTTPRGKYGPKSQKAAGGAIEHGPA